MDASRNSLMHSNDFELHDFFDDPNFDHFVDFIRGENDGDPLSGYNGNLIDESCVDNQFGSNPQGDNSMFDFNSTSNPMVSDLNFVLNSFSSFNNGDQYMKGGEEEGLGEEESIDGDDNSSGTTRTTSTTTPMSKKTKADRSRTLISERRRRGRMKEKLYALRALVPNITKMDKASIVGDAVLYVQDLQVQAKKLKAEIAGLEASFGAEKYQDSFENPKRTQLTRANNIPLTKKIMQMDVFQVEERGFYLRIVSNKGEGVAVSLYRALESLTGFNVQNSNLATLSERFVLTFTLNVKDCEQSMNLPNLKLWVTGALLNQGFEVITPLSA